MTRPLAIKQRTSDKERRGWAERPWTIWESGFQLAGQLFQDISTTKHLPYSLSEKNNPLAVWNGHAEVINFFSSSEQLYTSSFSLSRTSNTASFKRVISFTDPSGNTTVVRKYGSQLCWKMTMETTFITKTVIFLKTKLRNKERSQVLSW